MSDRTNELVEDLREWASIVGGCIPTRSIIDNKLSPVDARKLDQGGEMLTRAADKIEGLQADLEEAVKVAFKRGAIDWTRLNYPKLYERMMREHRHRERATKVAQGGGNNKD